MLYCFMILSISRLRQRQELDRVTDSPGGRGQLASVSLQVSAEASSCCSEKRPEASCSDPLREEELVHRVTSGNLQLREDVMYRRFKGKGEALMSYIMPCFSF